MWDCEWLSYITILHSLQYIGYVFFMHTSTEYGQHLIDQITPISFAPCALALVPTLPPNFRFLAPPMQCTNRQKQSKQQKWPLVYQSSHLCYDCTNRVPKTAKRQSKQQKSPLVYQSSHVYSESAEYRKSASAEYTKPIKSIDLVICLTVCLMTSNCEVIRTWYSQADD